MKRNTLLGIFFLVLVYLSNAPSANALVLFGYKFDDSAFSDDATFISGKVDYWGFSKWGYTETGHDNIDLDTALNGPDLYTLIEGQRINSIYYNYTVEVAFIDNYLYNGAGADLVAFERGSSAEPFQLAVFDINQNAWSPYLTFTPVRIGDLPDSVDVTRGVNSAEIDFALWGLPANLPVTRVLISTEEWTGTERVSADLAAFGGLNSEPNSVIPEPSSITFFLLAFACLILKKCMDPFQTRG